MWVLLTSVLFEAFVGINNQTRAIDMNLHDMFIMF